MRLLPIVAIYCVPLFAHSPGSPTDSLEAAVYKSFVKQHTAWAGGCESAVLDSGALPIAEGFQPYAFSRERVKPPKELVALLSQPVSSSASMHLQATGEPFFRVVDHSIIENLFSEEKCTIGDMQQHKCGWLKFSDDLGRLAATGSFPTLLSTRARRRHWSDIALAFFIGEKADGCISAVKRDNGALPASASVTSLEVSHRCPVVQVALWVSSRPQPLGHAIYRTPFSDIRATARDQHGNIAA